MIFSCGRQLWAVVFVMAWAGGPQSAFAASCKGDKKLDVPMQFVATIESSGRVHLSASGGSDKGGRVIPLGYGAWHLYDATGKELDFFTRQDLGFASDDMLKEVNLEGLIPGASYTVALLSQDPCGNKGRFTQALTMPITPPEVDPPAVSIPTVVQVGFLSYSNQLQFSATDNTGIKRVAIYINGNLTADYRYFDGFRFRWWCDPYTLDSVQSTLEGPNFYVSYPDGYIGTSALVEVVVDDWFGNQTRTSAQLGL